MYDISQRIFSFQIMAHVCLQLSLIGPVTEKREMADFVCFEFLENCIYFCKEKQ